MAVASPPTITEVITEFLGAAPTLEEIVHFRLPDALERRALDLLEQNRNGELTPEDGAELEELTRMGHFMNQVKLKARMQLAGEA
jgi:hypothetical protein